MTPSRSTATCFFSSCQSPFFLPYTCTCTDTLHRNFVLHPMPLRQVPTTRQCTSLVRLDTLRSHFFSRKAQGVHELYHIKWAFLFAACSLTRCIALRCFAFDRDVPIALCALGWILRTKNTHTIPLFAFTPSRVFARNAFCVSQSFHHHHIIVFPRYFDSL